MLFDITLYIHALSHVCLYTPCDVHTYTHCNAHPVTRTYSLTHPIMSSFPLSTGARTYDFDRVSQSAAWIKAINDDSEKVPGLLCY